MILLDTNVVSALMRLEPDTVVEAWLNKHPRESIWLSAVTAFEVQYGLAIMPVGKQRDELLDSYQHLSSQTLGGRMLHLDAAAAEFAAKIGADARAAGRPIEFRDTMIAGTAASRRARLATRNVKHFADCGISLENPWDVAV